MHFCFSEEVVQLELSTFPFCVCSQVQPDEHAVHAWNNKDHILGKSIGIMPSDKRGSPKIIRLLKYLEVYHQKLIIVCRIMIVQVLKWFVLSFINKITKSSGSILSVAYIPNDIKMP